MNCNDCKYKYSCGYSSMRAGKESRECIEPHLYATKLNGLVWSYKQQKLVPEKLVRIEELIGIK